METKNRRAFLGELGRLAAGVALGGVLLPGCGGNEGYGYEDSGDPTATPGQQPAGECLLNGADGEISANHGHELFVPEEDIAAAVEKTYDISGSASHSHNVTVTAAHFALLAVNDFITVESDLGNSAHTHSVTVRCA